MASSGSVTVEKASGETLRSLESEVRLSTVLPSVTCGQPVVGDVWMIEDGDEDAVPDDDMPEDVFLMDQQHAHHPLPLAAQEMRDNILQQLVQPYTNSDNPTSHAAQESNDRDQGQQAEDDTSSRGEVRLVPNSRSRSPRCSDSRSPLLQESPSPETRQGLGQWLESMGALDSMRGVWAPPILHSNLGLSRDEQSLRPTGQGCGEAGGNQEAGEGQRGAEEQEDCLRCSGEIA